jgi:hypothetical protein
MNIEDLKIGTFRKTMLYLAYRRFIGTVPHLCARAPSVFGSHATAGALLLLGTAFCLWSLNLAGATAHTIHFSGNQHRAGG